MILAIRCKGDDAPLPPLAAQGFAVVAFVQTEPLGVAFKPANPNAIPRFQNFALVMPIGFAQREVQRVSVTIDNHMAFDA